MMTAPQKHFNWDKLMADKDPSDFLVSKELWGDGQDVDNLTRQKYYSSLYNLSTGEKIKVLEVGFGSGLDFNHLKTNGWLNKIEYFGVDVTEKFVEHAKKFYPEMKAEKIDGYQLPYMDSVFNVVYCRHVLEHQTDYRPLLSEMMRVSKEYIFITLFIPTTTSDFDIMHFDGTWQHNYYSYKMFKDFVINHKNFKIVHAESFTSYIEDFKQSQEVFILKKSEPDLPSLAQL